MPIQSINRLELTALAVLGHDLSVAPKAWGAWLSQLQQYQSTTSYFPRPICRPSGNNADILVRNIVSDLIQLHNQSASKPSPVSLTEPVFSPLLVFDFERKVKQSCISSFDPFEIDLDEDGPLREEYVPKRRTSRASSDTRNHLTSFERRGDLQMSPLPPPSAWSPHADPLYHDAKRRFSCAPITMSGANNLSHGRSVSLAYPPALVWDTQNELPSGRWGSYQAEPRGVPRNNEIKALSLGFPVPSACPATGHTRTTSLSIDSSQLITHLQSHAQYLSSGCNDPRLPLSRSQYAVNNSVFPCDEGDPVYFRTTWLKA